MLIEITGKYSSPVSIVEVVHSTKKPGDKVSDPGGRNPIQMTKACLLESWVSHKVWHLDLR